MENIQNINPRISMVNTPDTRITRISTIVNKKRIELKKILDEALLKKTTVSLKKLSNIIREKEFLKELKETTVGDTKVLEGILDVISLGDPVTGMTPIMKLIQNNDINALELLLKKANQKLTVYNSIEVNSNKIHLHNILDIKNNNGHTALDLARINNSKCYDILLNYIQIDIQSSAKYTYLTQALNSGDPEAFKKMLDTAEKQIPDSYSFAAYLQKTLLPLSNSVKCVSLFLEKFASVPPFREISVDPKVAATQAKLKIIENAFSEKRAKLNKLFDVAGPVNEKLVIDTLNSITDESELIKTLGETTRNDKTPECILNVLTVAENGTGMTPIMMAVQNNDIKALNFILNKIEQKRVFTNNSKFNTYLEARNSLGDTALNIAIANGSLPCVNTLLNSGAKLGLEPAIQDSYIIQAIQLNDPAILKSLLNSAKRQFRHNPTYSLDAYLKRCNKSGELPISIAIEKEALLCANLLIKNKVEIPLKNQEAYNILCDKAIVEDVDLSDNIITQFFKNIFNSILSLLRNLGILK